MKTKNKKTSCNSKDHQVWSRRSFIQALGLAGAGTMGLAGSSISFAKQSELSAAINAADNDNILVIIRLFGGNDSLNMVVPINQYDEYANARPTLKRATNTLWSLTDEYSMPNLMSPLESMWGDGKMKIVNSVGYENQSQSHFKGTDVWESTDVDNQVDQTGWLGKYYEELHPDYLINPPSSPTAVQIGALKNITFDGAEAKYSFSVNTISRLKIIANKGLNYPLDNLPDCLHGDKVSFMRSSANSTYKYSGVIYDAYNSSVDYTAGDGYLDDDLGATLNTVARLIKGNLGTKVYMLSVRGFDTHISQQGVHDQLLTSIGANVKHFYDDLTQAGWGDKVATMSVSEFGRRLHENGSRGTDHGVAGSIMLFGEGLNGSSVEGQHSSLKQDDLLNGRDLQHHTDFRSVYSIVLKDWMCVDPQIVDNVVLGGTFDDSNLALGFDCRGDGGTILSTASQLANVFDAQTITKQEDTYIDINNNYTQHLSIKLYSLLGQEVGTIKSELMSVGKHLIPIKASLGADLPSGYFIYRISSNRGTISRKVFL